LLQLPDARALGVEGLARLAMQVALVRQLLLGRFELTRCRLEQLVQLAVGGTGHDEASV
jgi:hypothetical protein